MKIGNIVKNGTGMEFEILEIRDRGFTYQIRTQEVESGEKYTFTLDGKYQTDQTSVMDLIIPKEVVEPVVEEVVEEVVEPVVEEVVEEVVEPVVEEVVEEVVEPVVEEEVSFISPLLKLEDIVYKGDNKITFNTGDTINIGMTPYEASLKTTKLELLAELTSLVENNTAVEEVILKVKKLKKLLEL